MLTGTYKLDVGGITLYDWRDGHEVDGTSIYDLSKSSRKLTSIGTLRISTLEETIQHGVVSDPGLTCVQQFVPPPSPHHHHHHHDATSQLGSDVPFLC